MDNEPPASLFLMRHAKSSWKHSDLPDHDRPLKKRGRRQAVEMGEFLKTRNVRIERILTSTAVRALETARLVARTLRLGEPETEPRLYEADISTWRQVISELPISVGVLLVGHNPTLEELLTEIAADPIRMPTSSIAALRRWRGTEVPSQLNLELRHVWRPKEIATDSP